MAALLPRWSSAAPVALRRYQLRTNPQEIGSMQYATSSRHKQAPQQHAANETSSGQPKHHPQPEMASKINLTDMFLNAKPWVRGVVYTAIGVIAVAESYTYFLWYRRWMYPPAPPSADENADAMG